MAESTAPRKVAPTELLEIREKQWRRRAEAISLAAETFDEIPTRQREETLIAYGRLQKKLGPGSARARLFRRYPTVHVLATAGVGADRYERGTFWPKLISILGITPDPEFQRDWGEAFLDNLRKLGLPAFENDDDAGSKFVGRILLHAGMPTYCLADFFRILAWKRGSTPGLTAEEFVSWAAKKAAGSGFANVDMPVQRFVRYGDEFAVDVAGRSFELLDALAAGSSLDEILLPQRFCEVAQELYDRRGIELASNGGQSTADQRDIRPRLVIDPYGQGLVLRLPPVGDAPDGRAVWVVALDGDTQQVATESLWPGSMEPAPQTDVAVVKPVRSASVALAGREDLQLSLIVVDDKDPLLAFGEDCELIPRGLPLPAGKVWLLFPGAPDSLGRTGPVPVVVESPLPPCWSGFCLVQVDLSDAAVVRVGGSTRTVRKTAAAQIETEPPVRGIRTTSGLPVVAVLPRIEIPSSMASADWEVTLHDSSGEVIARRRVTGPTDPNELWNSVARPLVGTFTVRVRGPWGCGTSRTFTVVEGLSASFSPSWRRFVPAGLEPCLAQVSVGEGVDLTRNQMDFVERKRECVVRAGAHSQFRSLVVTPPHMTVAYQAEGFVVSPSVRPLSLIREDVRDNPGELILDIGADAEPTLYVIANSRVVQKISARSGRTGVYRFSLAAITDTLRDYPQAKLALSDDGNLVIATVRPRTLFTGVELVGEELELADCVSVEGLCVYLFATRAPWREPACVPVVEGRVKLPAWLIDAGPIRVMARIEDPWVPLPVPDWPRAGESRLVEADGWVADGTPEEKAISGFLAGDNSQPVEVVDFVRLWTVRSLLPSLSLGARITELSDAIDTEIYANPAAALAALTGSEAPSEAIPALMVRSGLAWANLADAHEDNAPPWTVRGALPAALLSAADSLWSEDEIEAALQICGDSVTEILDGNDPYGNVGHIDKSAELFDREPGLREQLIREAGLIPKGLLSADSRVIASMEFLRDRHDPKLEWLMKHAHSVLREGERLLRIIGDPASQKAFDARCHRERDGGWRVIPAISMAFALAARHAARGHVEANRWIVREQRPWADLAAVAPQLVTIDMIIAELTVGRRIEDEARVSE